MRELFTCIDGVLRGHYSRRENLAAGRIDVPALRLLLLGLILGAAYGACMGLFALLRGAPGGWLQVLASAAKVPLLFLLTLCVTFPSLYVFSALFGSRLRADVSLRLLLLAVAVNLAVLASFGPVTAFFTLSTESYPFMVLLNVALFAIAGFIALGFLRRAITVVFERRPEEPPQSEVAPTSSSSSSPPPLPPSPPPSPPPPASVASAAARPAEQQAEPPPYPYWTSSRTPARAASTDGRSRAVFGVWLVLYGVVGAQMGWILRPFIGDPNLPFELFRERESHFFQAVLRTLGDLFAGR